MTGSKTTLIIVLSLCRSRLPLGKGYSEGALEKPNLKPRSHSTPGDSFNQQALLIHIQIMDPLECSISLALGIKQVKNSRRERVECVENKKRSTFSCKQFSPLLTFLTQLGIFCCLGQWSPEKLRQASQCK